MKKEPSDSSSAPAKKVYGSSSAPAKKPLKFAPKIPAKRSTRPVVPKPEPVDSKDDVIDKELLSKLNSVKNEGFGRRQPKNERKFPSAQGTFGLDANPTQAKPFGKPAHVFGGNASLSKEDKVEEEYIDPWDHSRSPCTSLPWRRPYSGKPEVLDEEEFGEASTSAPLNETEINPALELGLLENADKPQMIFFQLPASLPSAKLSDAGAKGKGLQLNDEEKKPVHQSGQNIPKGCTLKDLPGGLIGKMQVYRSGAVKLKLGDIVFDVSSGSECVFAQDVAAISTELKQCCVLGELRKRAIVTPDLDALLDSREATDSHP